MLRKPMSKFARSITSSWHLRIAKIHKWSICWPGNVGKRHGQWWICHLVWVEAPASRDSSKVLEDKTGNEDFSRKLRRNQRWRDNSSIFLMLEPKTIWTCSCCWILCWIQWWQAYPCALISRLQSSKTEHWFGIASGFNPLFRVDCSFSRICVWYLLMKTV